jgi:GntR family transcriptional regulator of arabinose operon
LQIKEYILSLVASSEDEMMKIPSERELCRIHNVCRPTVRQAIDSLVDEGILEPKRGLGTFINRQALEKEEKGLPRNTTIGITFFDGGGVRQGGGFTWMLMQNIVNTLAEKGLNILFASTKKTGMRAAEELLQKGISGLIWISPDKKQFEALRCLKAKGLPVMAINRKIDVEKIDYVNSDQEHGGYIAGKYLLERGHRKVLFVAKEKVRPLLNLRYSGFEKAFAEEGLTVDSISVSEASEVYLKIKRLISQKDFTAIFTADGIYLPLVYNALRDEGKSVPDDYSLISYDESNLNIRPDLKITEIHQPLEEMGNLAGQTIIDKLTNRNSRRLQQVLKPFIWEGNSCIQL